MGTESAVIDWEQKVRAFAKVHNFPNYRSALDWLVKRDCLETIAGLVGAEVWDGFNHMNHILNSLGAWLDHRGWNVPPMHCAVTSYAYDQASRIAEPPPTFDEPIHSGTDIQMQDYLKIRMQGRPRTRAGKILGVNTGTFYNLLERWGIKDMKVEAELLNRIKENPVILDEMSSVDSVAPSKPVQPSEAPTEYKRTVALHLTLTEAVIRESINALVDATEGWTANLPVDKTLTGAIWASMARARQSGVDVATELVKRLREVAG